MIFCYLKSYNDHKCGKKYFKLTCPSCGKKVSSTNYARHIKFHSEARFKCDICNSNFVNQAKKDKHMNVHAKHTCTFCGKSFPRPSILHKHLEVHKTNELAAASEQTQENSSKTGNSLKCKVCNSELSSATKMIQHMQKFHKEEALKCDHCSKEFFTKSGLRKHKKNHRILEQVEGNAEDGLDVTNREESDVPNNNQFDPGQFDVTNDTFGSSYIILQNLSEIEDGNMVGGNELENVIILAPGVDSNTEEIIDQNGQPVDLNSIQFTVNT